MSYIGRTPTNAALTASDLADGIVSSGKIAADAVTSAKIADNAVVTAAINADAVTSAKIADNAVVTAAINADAVTDAKIADDVVGTEHLTANEVDTTALGADAVTGDQLADNAVNSEHYTDGSIDTAHIADGQVTTAKLATAVFTGATDIGAAIVDADLFLMDDGAGGTIRKTTASRIKTYAGGGKVVKFNFDNATPFISTTSTNYSDLASVEIQPSATSSKILVMAVVAEPDQIDGRIKASIIRDSTDLSDHAGTGVDSGGRIVSEFGRGLSDTGTEQHFGSICHFMIDTPGTTSNITYYVKVKSGTGGQIRVGNGGASNILAIELGA